MAADVKHGQNESILGSYKFISSFQDLHINGLHKIVAELEDV